MAYSKSQAKDFDRAQSLAVSFRDNTAKKSLTEIGKDPANAAAVKAFQDAAGLTADGKVGPKTLEAYNVILGIPFTQKTATKEQIHAQSVGTFKAAVADVVTPNIMSPPTDFKPTVTKTATVVKAPVMKAGIFDSLSMASPGTKVGLVAVVGAGLYSLFGGKRKDGRGHG